MQPPGRTYGRLNYKDASTTDLMNWEPTSELLAMMRDKQESIYASTKAEPLGRSMERGHVLPAHMTGDKFAFGKPGDRGNGGSKEALFPAVSHPRVPGVPKQLRLTAACSAPASHLSIAVTPQEEMADEVGGAHDLYLKSHADYNPGEQKKRGYDWNSTGIDPVNHRFGVSEKMSMGGGSEEVMKAMDPTLTQGERSYVVSATVENFKDFANAELGAVKKLGLAQPAGLPEDHAYGVKSEGKDAWGTAECIKGAYGETGQQPDKDLGTTLRPGWRNQVAPGDDDRKFGVPGVRTDIAPPRARSVADHQNYGDEPGAFTVMYPSKYAVNGVDELDFNSPMSKAKLKTIVQIAFPDVDDATFDKVYEAGSTAHDGDEFISVETWRAAYNQIFYGL